MRDVEELHAELALLAARFVLPDLDPDVDRPMLEAMRLVLPDRSSDVDRAIKLPCDLLVCGRDTPPTVDVAALRYGIPLRDAGPVIREMLREQGFPAPGREAGEDEKFLTVLRALAAGGLQVGELFMFRFLAWQEQDELKRRLVVLLNDWDQQTTPQGRSAAAEALRAAARGHSGAWPGVGWEQWLVAFTEMR